ncbi:cytochrome P450 [Saccharopolyspora indica]|nr:cytochrome P450 [Saccharopolyspora indica]MDA3647653.1 cytochrome P450 [Saccharopolyspora indica]
MEPAEPAATYPFGPGTQVDPEPEYGRFRREQPVAKVKLAFGGEAWLVTRYADVKAVLNDSRFSRAATVEAKTWISQSGPEGASLVIMDPPEHTRIRTLVAKAFTARRIEALRPRIQQITDEMLDGMERAGQPADLIAHLSLPLPVAVICELLGVPFDDHQKLRTWSETIMSSTAFSAEETGAAYGQLAGYLAGLIAQRRERPTEDLLGALVVARDEQDKLSEQEMISVALTILVAGHDTTASHIGNSTYALLRRPDQWALLRDDPALLERGVEELLRYLALGVSSGLPRVATEDIELGGVLIKAGDSVIPSITAANLDEDVFDAPDRIDLTREHNPHIAFGHGIHHCLGAQLARVELQVALSTLARRFPDLRLAVPEEELSWKTGLLMRGFRELPVTW